MDKVKQEGELLNQELMHQPIKLVPFLFDIDNSQITTDFLWLYLMNEYNRLLELASGNNQPNFECSNDKRLSCKANIKHLKTQAEQNRAKAIQEFEWEIFS